MTRFSCGYCGRRHDTLQGVYQCGVKDPRPFASRLPWEQWPTKRSRRRPRPELNVERCPTCRADGGKPCVSKRTQKVLMLTHSTHKKMRIEKAREQARAKDPNFKPMALDETYDR